MHKNLAKCVLLLSGLVGLLLAGVARSELVVDITGGVQQAMPIAVVPFGWQNGSQPAGLLDVASVVSADLKRSGRFAPILRGDMLQQPTSEAGVDFSDWRLLGVEALIVGFITPRDDGQYTVQFQLFDVFRSQQLLGYRLNTSEENLRAAAHRIADMVYEELTGQRGAFSARIAYVAVDGEPPDRDYRLVVADSDGENPVDITTARGPIISPAWSPDGQRIAYVWFENNRPAIYLQTLATGERVRLSSEDGVNSAPAFSPNGTKLALTLSRGSNNLDIYVLDLATKQLTRMTSSSAIDTEPAWTPDGKKILFTSDRGGSPQIYELNLDGGSARRVTFEGNYNARPRVSPDGRYVALVHNDRGSFRIAVFDLETRTTQVLTAGRLDESPSFAPNGQMIIYATERGGQGILAAVAVDGSVEQRLSERQADVREPVWSPFPPQ